MSLIELTPINKTSTKTNITTTTTTTNTSQSIGDGTCDPDCQNGGYCSNGNLLQQEYSSIAL